MQRSERGGMVERSGGKRRDGVVLNTRSIKT